jgi:hypothetical protein
MVHLTNQINRYKQRISPRITEDAEFLLDYEVTVLYNFIITMIMFCILAPSTLTF